MLTSIARKAKGNVFCTCELRSIVEFAPLYTPSIGPYVACECEVNV